MVLQSENKAHKLRFKKAETRQELEQLYRLNYRIFVEELGQHPRLPSQSLVDRFDQRNHYFLALRGDIVVGMISAHTGPDFSVARRLPNSSLLDNFARPVEVRLLAVEQDERGSFVLAGLLWQVYEFAAATKSTHMLISGVAEREPMYRKLGFSPLGAVVADGAARFIPMFMSLEQDGLAGSDGLKRHFEYWNRRASAARHISLLPGPVNIHPSVEQSYSRRPVSHRDPDFIVSFEAVRSRLRGLVPGLDAAIFPGGGTLANDTVAANLQAMFGKQRGLILSNGEFGTRLVRQAEKAGLHFQHLCFPWCSPWQMSDVQAALSRKLAWVWAVHLETSTGMLNDIDALGSMADAAGTALVLDCVSSLGAVPIHPHETLLFASGVSGKSLGSFAGLAFIYLGELANHLPVSKQLCPSFDLMEMQRTYGPVSTVPSAPVFALAQALENNYASHTAADKYMRDQAELGRFVREQLQSSGISPLVAEPFAAPNITSFVLPNCFEQKCGKAGYDIAHRSGYLQARGWGQIATMGDMDIDRLAPLFEALSR